MQVKTLESIPFEAIIDCFVQAFENYFVQMPTSPEYYRKRWELAKVDYSRCYGAFDGEKLVGFMIHAVDQRDGELIAFNTGTGVLPAYRGRRIVKTMYENAIPALKQQGFSKCALEVITQNDRATKAYESVGFRITRTLKCYRGEFQAKQTTPFQLRSLPLKSIDWNSYPNQSKYSWDNHATIIAEGAYAFYEVMVEEEPSSFFVIDPESGYIPQLDVLSPTPNAWATLFSAIQSISPSIKINNVDTRLEEKIRGIEAVELPGTVDQYEMEMVL